jgi:hypothetical protein
MRFCRAVLLALSFILFTPATALAQLNPVSASIDLTVAQAGHVVIGHIAEMGEASGNAERSERRQSIVLAVDETLKGEYVSRLPLVIAYELWEQLDRGKILCSTCAAHTHRLLVTIRPMEDHPSSVTDLDSHSAFDVSGDLRVLSTGDAILQAAREEVRRCPGVVGEKDYFIWGPSVAFMPGTPFHGETVYVPVDERQETLAHQVLDSERVPAGVTRVRENDREEAASVLGHFRSPENVQLMKSLLNDPQIEHDVMGELDYTVRAVAYRVLRQWGVDVPQPVTRVKIQEPWDGLVPPH